MLVGSCDIQNDINIRVGEKLIHIVVQLRDIVLLYSVLRAFSDKVADADYLDILEHIGDIFKIYAGNSAYSDKTDSYLSHVVLRLCLNTSLRCFQNVRL